MGQRNKTAIILVGGGMKSAHGGGFLQTLATEIGITAPDIMIGSSGDAGNVAYFAAGQYESNHRIWTKLLSTPRFISLARFWRMMDVDYLIDEVFKKQEPLDTERLARSPIEWLIPITDFDSGEVRYVGARDGEDVFEVLRAAKAIPFFYGKRPVIRGHRYIDGEIGPILQDYLEKVFELGATQVLIINHLSPWTAHSKLYARIYAALASAGLHDAIARDISHDITKYEAGRARVIFVNPKGLPVSTATRDQRKLEATYDRGVEDALLLRDELLELLGPYVRADISLAGPAHEN